MWYQEREEGVLLQIKVIPNSRQNEIVGQYGTSTPLRTPSDFLKIKIAAVPEKEKANKELIKYLSKLFNLTFSDVKIVKGRLQRIKLVFLPVAAERLEKSLDLLLNKH